MLDDGWSYARIGREVGLDRSTVSYWARKHGLRSPHTDRDLARGGLPREGLAEAVAQGLSTREIAARFDVSQSTVRHWLREYGFTTLAAELRRERRDAQRDRAALRALRCRRHGLTEFRLEARGSYRCMKCRSENVANHRRRQKATLVAEAGGRCELCGYDRHIGALHFHHRDPATKSFTIAARGMTRSLAAARAEMQKCVLLCGNCHAEVEAGVRSL
jgi:transposase-like protein